MSLQNISPTNLLELIKRASFGTELRAERFFVSQSGATVYIAAIRKLDVVKVLHKLSQLPVIRHDILDDPNFTGVYAEFNNLWIFVYSPKEDVINLGVDTFNQSVDSNVTNGLVSFGKAQNIQILKLLAFDIFIVMYETYSELMGAIFGLNQQQIYRLKRINTFKTFIQNYTLLSTGGEVGNSLYTDIFSGIYYVEICALTDLFENTKEIVIHDVASNTANLPMLLCKLQQEKRIPFKIKSISCSDFSEEVLSANLAITQEALGYFDTDLAVHRVDLRNENPILKEADVIIANDVLEHFEDEESQNVFHNLWRHTRNILIIHVPIEEFPNAHFGHFTNFTDEKLDAWANKLPSCINLTRKILAQEQFAKGCDLSGFLILQRVQ